MRERGEYSEGVNAGPFLSLLFPFILLYSPFIFFCVLTKRSCTIGTFKEEESDRGRE